MKRIVSLTIGLIILAILGVLGYKFFFDCEEYVTSFDKYFTLEKFDYAKVNDEAIVKLLNIKDNRCLEETCEREGEFEVQLLVINDMRISYVTLGMLSGHKKNVKTSKKTGYDIELIRVDEDKATLKLIEQEK